MKLLSFSQQTEIGANRTSFGVATGIDGADGIIDLGDRLDGVCDLSDLLAQERVGEARTIAESATPTL